MIKLIPKKQTAWGKLEYDGPNYYQLLEQMKKEDPQAYNRLQIANARSQQPSSEIVIYTDAEGKPQTATNNIGMSGTDPIGQLYVEGVVLNPIFKGLGKVAQYGLAKLGNNWARAKVLSKEIQNVSTPSNVLQMPLDRVNTQSAIGNPINVHNGVGQYMPNQLVEEVKRGKEAAAKFFERPIVRQTHQHNKELAKRLGINLNDRPNNISEVIRKPIKVNWSGAQGNEYANIRQAYYGDDSAELTFNWRPFDTKTFGITNIHENLHRGYYSAPIRFPNISKEYYNNVYKPSYQFYKWKTDKLLKPEFRDGYLGDISGGEAGPNLIDLGRDLGLKLGQKYPGYEQVKQMLQNYKGFKSFIIPQLNDSKAGLRHVWDAMTGKYFTIPAATLTSLKNKNSQPSN